MTNSLHIQPYLDVQFFVCQIILTTILRTSIFSRLPSTNNLHNSSSHNDNNLANIWFSSEDVELRRIFPNDFPQDTIRKSGSLQPEVGILKCLIFLF